MNKMNAHQQNQVIQVCQTLQVSNIREGKTAIFLFLRHKGVQSLLPKMRELRKWENKREIVVMLGKLAIYVVIYKIL